MSSRVLIIESDKLLANNLSLALQRAGHKVDWVFEPQAAIDSADKHQPDVVIMELMLADRSGVEFLNEFRSYSEWQSLPVIIYSEIPVEQFSLSGSFTQLGIRAYHQKPHTSLRQIVDSVNEVLALSTA